MDREGIEVGGGFVLCMGVMLFGLGYIVAILR